jgi:hypothetical protein
MQVLLGAATAGFQDSDRRRSLLLLLPAFDSQDLSSRTSINGHWVSGSRVSGPRYSALRTWVSRPRQAHARTQRTPGVPGPGPAKTGSSPRSSAAGHERDPVLSGRARSSVCDGPELRHGRTHGQTRYFIYKIVLNPSPL